MPGNAVDAALARVDQLDLSPINQKLQHDDPSFWTDEVLTEIEANYRRFLALNLLHPSTSFSVNKLIDDYWHQHILDTRKYAADCELVFGHVLHHDPYFGLEDEQEWQANVETFAFTQDVWEEAFGEPMVTTTPRLTLDRVIGGYQADPDLSASRIYAFPQTCKCGQHCDKIISPEIFDPGELDLPLEPFEPVRRDPLVPLAPERTLEP
jgi:hypothetical protein